MTHLPAVLRIYTLPQTWLSILFGKVETVQAYAVYTYIIFNLISMAITILIIFHIEGKFQFFDNSSQSVQKSCNYFQLQNCTATNVELHQRQHQHHHNWSTINPLFFPFPCLSRGVVEAQKRIAAKRQLTDPGNQGCGWGGAADDGSSVLCPLKVGQVNEF